MLDYPYTCPVLCRTVASSVQSEASYGGMSAPGAAHTESTIVFLKSDCVEIVAVSTGNVLLSLPTMNLKESVYAESVLNYTIDPSRSKIGMGHFGHKKLPTELVRNSAAHQHYERVLEGRPTTVHWCPITHLVFVGFTSGGVGLLSMGGLIHSTLPKVPFTHLQSTQAHGTDISRIITFRHSLKRQNLDGAPKKEIVAALVGDANGMLSVWQIYPPA